MTVELRPLGVRHARLHLLEVDHDEVGRKYALSDDENVAALMSFADLEPELPGLHLDVFHDLRNMLVGRDNNVTCLWTGCDCYATRSVYGIEGDGQSSNCGRTNKDGVDFTKASAIGYERYLALYHTPQEHGGCQGCRFFLMCKGSCPGTALDRDWRNRSAQCGVWKQLYTRFEEECLDQGVVPLSISPKRPKVERLLLDHWSRGQQCYVHQALASRTGQRATGQCGTVACEHQDGSHGDRHGAPSARRATASSGPRAPLPGFPRGHPESGSPPCTFGDIRVPSGADARHWRPTATRLLVSDASLSSLGFLVNSNNPQRIRMRLFHATPANSKHPPWLSARETLYAQFAGGARPAPG